MKPSPDYGWHSIGMGGNNCDELTQLTMSQSGFAKSAITWMCSKHLGGRKLARCCRARYDQVKKVRGLRTTRNTRRAAIKKRLREAMPLRREELIRTRWLRGMHHQFFERLGTGRLPNSENASSTRCSGGRAAIRLSRPRFFGLGLRFSLAANRYGVFTRSSMLKVRSRLSSRQRRGAPPRGLSWRRIVPSRRSKATRRRR
jgi:hypothetical protein